MSFPVVKSKRTIALSVDDAGPTTSPDPDGVAHVLSHLRNVDADGVPVALSFAIQTTLLSIVQVAQLPETVISPLSPSVTQDNVSILS